jgi:hypothetical protein
MTLSLVDALVNCSGPEESLVPAPPWTADELGKRASIEHFFGRVFSLPTRVLAHLW